MLLAEHSAVDPPGTLFPFRQHGSAYVQHHVPCLPRHTSPRTPRHSRVHLSASLGRSRGTLHFGYSRPYAKCVGETIVPADAQPAGPPVFISPVARPVPLRQSVYEALVELVVGGRLGPGEHLVETELARQRGGAGSRSARRCTGSRRKAGSTCGPTRAPSSTSPPTTRSMSCSTSGNCWRYRWPGWPRARRLPAG